MTQRNAALAVVGIMLVLSGCRTWGGAAGPSPTPFWTSTPLQPAPTATWTATASPSPTPTLTSIPALPPEEAYDMLLELLQTNGGCELPCWWGISPGVSTHEEAETKLEPLLGIAAGFYPGKKGSAISLDYPVGELLLSLSLNYKFPLEDRIEMLYISTEMLRYIEHEEEGSGFQFVYDSPAYHDLLAPYTLDRMLAAFGPPEEVLVRGVVYAERYPGLWEEMFLTLLYPERGIFVRYTMVGERDGDKFVGCPARAFIDLWLIPPGREDYEALLSLTGDWEGDFVDTRSLKEATGMSVGEFYRLFQNPNRCIETPLSVWPMAH